MNQRHDAQIRDITHCNATMWHCVLRILVPHSVMGCVKETGLANTAI